MPQETADTHESEISPSQVQAELEAVLRSPAFERSERLQRFLRFICELTLKGEGTRINEYLIGSEVFQRGAGYSPSEDSIVRRQAHALRQKLQDYYASDGGDHEIRIELPIGRYVPVFRRIAIAAPALGTAAASGAPAAPVSAVRPFPFGIRLAHWQVGAAALALLATGLLAGWLLSARTEPAQIGEGAREIWGNWLTPKTDAVICFSNPMTAVIKHFDKPLPADAQPRRFRAHPDEEQLFRDTFRLPAGGVFYYTPVVNQTKMGEAIAAVHLAALLTKARVTVRSTQSRFLSWEDIRKENLILLGHNEANKWLDPLLKDQPFRLAETSGSEQRGIVNTRPQPGELKEFHIAYSQSENDADREYALVSMISGVDGKHRLLTISGLNTQATQIATEYLTSETGSQELLSRLRKDSPNHRGPWHFQAVLRTEVYDKVPTRATLIAVRVL
jgi:hypothetical protein